MQIPSPEQYPKRIGEMGLKEAEKKSKEIDKAVAELLKELKDV